MGTEESSGGRSGGTGTGHGEDRASGARPRGAGTAARGGAARESRRAARELRDEAQPRPAAGSVPWNGNWGWLVDRSPRGSRLTDAGALVTDWARRVVEAAEAFDAGAQALRRPAGLAASGGGEHDHRRVSAAGVAARAARAAARHGGVASRRELDGRGGTSSRGRGGPRLRGGAVRAARPRLDGHRARPADRGDGAGASVGPASRAARRG